MTRYGTVECVICGDTALKSGARQTTCGKPECRDANSAARRRESAQRATRRRRGENAPLRRVVTVNNTGKALMSAPLAGVIGDVVLTARDREHDPSTVALARQVSLAADAVRTKDRANYRSAVLGIAAWALRELVRVRPDGDASAS